MEIVNQMPSFPGQVNRPFTTVRTKLFRAFKAAVGTYVEIPEWSPVGDFEIEVLLSTTAAVRQDICGKELFLKLRIEADGKVQALIGDGNAWTVLLISGSAAINDGALHSIKLAKAGPDYSVRIDGELDQSKSDADSVVPAVNALYRVTDSFDGYPYSTRLTDLAVPSQSRLYRNFTRPDHIVPNELATLGAELAAPSSIVPDSVEAGSFELNGRKALYTIVNSWGQRQLTLPVPFKAGKTYWISARTLNGNRLTLKFSNIKDMVPSGWVQNDYYGAYQVISGGVLDVALTIPEGANVADAHIGIASNGQDGKPGSAELSIREADGFGQLHNPAEGSVQRHTKKGRAWLGPELWSNPIVPAGITDNGDGVYSANNPGSILSVTSENSPEIGALYQTVFDVLDVSQGLFRSRVGNTNGLDATAAQTYISENVVAAASNSMGFQCSGNAVGSFRPRSIRRKIPIAGGVA